MNEQIITPAFSYAHKLTMKPSYNETSLHEHEMYEIFYLISGNAELILENGKVPLSAGALLLIAPRVRHRIGILSPLPYERLVLNLRFLPTGGSEFLFEKVRLVETGQAPRIVAVMERMRDYGSFFEGAQRETVLDGLLKELLLVLEKTVRPEETVTGIGKLMGQALSYIERQVTEIRDVEELCKELGVSRAWLYREFQSTLGISPKKYINRRRLHIARHLLELGEDATRVAYRCGWREYSAFFRAYRTYFGVAPGKGQRKANL